MIIERLDLLAYGHLTDQTFDLSSGPHRFQLIYGANESGKSTSMRAITSWLFGFPHRTDDDFLHASSKLRVGGRLRSQGDELLVCIRRKGNRATLRAADDETVIEESVLARMLGGIDEATFTTRFALSHDELLRGGEQILRGEGELGAILFAAGAGIGRLKEIYNQLSGDLGQLFKPRAIRCQIAETLKRIDTDRKQLKQLQVPPTEFASLRSEIKKIEQRLDGLRRRAEELNRQRARWENAAAALPLIPRFELARNLLAEVADAPELASDFVERRRRVDRERLLNQQTLQSLIARRDELAARLETTPLDAAIESHQDELCDVYRELPIREKAERDRAGLVDQVNRIERRMRSRLRDVLPPEGIATPTADEDGDPLGQKVETLQLNESARATIGRLASQYEKLVQRCDDANDEVARLEQKRDELQRELTANPIAVDPEVISRAIEDVGPPENLLVQWRQSTTSAEQLRRQCETIQRRLHVTASLEQTVALELPDRATLTELTNLIEQHDEALKQCRSRRREFEQDHQRALAEAEAIEGSDELPTMESLQDARSHRDEQIIRLPRSDSLEHVIEELKRSVALSDRIADQLRIHQETILRRQVAAKKIDSIVLQLSRLLGDEQSVERQRDDATTRWQCVWQPIVSQPGPPVAMRAWMTDHGQLVEAFERYQQAVAAADLDRHQVELAIQRLRVALPSDAPLDDVLGDDEDLGRTLTRLHAHAIRIRAEQIRERGRLDRWTAQADECAMSLPAARAACQNRAETLRLWQTQWRNATARLRSEHEPTPADVLPMLEAIQDLAAMKRERDILRHRIASIDDEAKAYFARVEQLVMRIDGSAAKNPSDQSLATIAKTVAALQQRWQRQQSASESRQQTQSELVRCREQCESAEESSRRSLVELDQLRRECGAASVQEIDELETRARRRVDAMEKLDAITAQLMSLAGGQDLDTFVAETKELRVSAIDESKIQVAAERESVEEEIAQQREHLGGLRHQFAKIDGGGAASELAQHLQFAMGRLQRDSQRAIRLQLAGTILRRAIEHYRQENQGPVLAAAQRFFETLTLGEYRGLKVDFDTKGTPALFGLRDESAVPAPRMSAGTADALYLSLRLASLQHQLRHGEAVPLIVDDCLIQLDDDRASAALQVLAELSTTTQVILFTHHRHLVDLATGSLTSDQVHVHTLRSAKEVSIGV